MEMIHKLFFATALCLFYEVASQVLPGDRCIQDGRPGDCTPLGQCQTALTDAQTKWWNLYRCGFQGNEPVICCVSPTTTTQKPVATTPKMGPSTTLYVPEEYDYQPNEPIQEGCPQPIPGVTAAKTGRKAWDKCIDYQADLIYPCKESVALFSGMVRGNNCHQNADGLIVGGQDAAVNEFPHMVLLGYGQSSETAVWQCAGTLLSEKFILTAGHCTSARDAGPVTYAIVGSLRRSDKIDSSQVHRIQRIIKHPGYQAPSKYNDIALLETLQPILLGASAVPACLDIFGGNSSKAVATGWGATAWRGDNADTLQKVTLTRFKDHECRKKFPPSHNMERGLDINTQVCYGDYEQRLDTCQGDSGGPLTIPNKQVTCTYIVVGVTSFGKACGAPKSPGIYTKVSYYVPWIESIVWPQ